MVAAVWAAGLGASAAKKQGDMRNSAQPAHSFLNCSGAPTHGMLDSTCRVSFPTSTHTQLRLEVCLSTVLHLIVVTIYIHHHILSHSAGVCGGLKLRSHVCKVSSLCRKR